MRASDIGILKPVDATMIASGGAERTILRLAGADVPTLTEGSPGFFRDDFRLAPYNLFVSLAEAAASPGANWKPPGDPYLPFGDANDFSGDVPVTTIAATFSDSHTTSWEYSGDGWTRPESLAQSGDDFVADNVLLLRVKVGDAGYLDPGGYAVPETFFYGEGEAILVHGDQALRCVWTKKDEATALTLSTAQGDDITVPAGHTWIELVPAKDGQVTLVSSRRCSKPSSPCHDGCMVAAPSVSYSITVRPRRSSRRCRGQPDSPQPWNLRGDWSLP
ncbi:MAG: DUF3048 C-terminal domain-containing protein [Nocardioidaceae bacterium]